VAVAATLASLVRLPVIQRSSVVLVDVLGHSLAAASDILGVSIAAVLVRNPADPSGTVRYVVLLDWVGGQIARIRDFKYAPYVRESQVISSL